MNNAFFKQFPIAFWILFFGIAIGTINTQAQSGTVSVDFHNASPKEIIENLESRTPYKFVYQKDMDLNAPRISLKRDNVSVDEILKDLEALTNLNFRRNNNNIAVNKKASPKKKGKIIGRVIDNTGLSLPGATIKVVETGLASISGPDGNYMLPAEPGAYSIEASFMSFQTQIITGVQVSEDNATTLNIALKEESQSLEEVVITQTYQKATASVEGLLLQQKRAAQFSDGISAEQIARTPDRDVGATLKRITGVTAVDDKYVVVRSMGERWNQAVMDGVNLPSTDANQQQFNFEIIPTAMVESIVVSKNATPDMYANFAGGYVEIKTKSIPKENFTSFSVGTSYNSRSTFKDRLTRQEGTTDYLGFDDGTRDYPPGLVNIPVPTSEDTSGPFFEQSKKFTEDNFTTFKTFAAPGTSLQLAIGRLYNLKDNNKWGFVGSLIFRNTQEQLKIEHTERGSWMPNTVFSPETENGYTTLTKYGFKNSGASYNFNSTLGGMFNAGIQLGHHKITFRNTLMHIYDSQLTQTTGWNYYAGNLEGVLNGSLLPYTQETSYPIYQAFIQNKIEGEHQFGDVKLDWFAAYGSTDKDTKDATFLHKSRKRIGEDELTYQNIYNSATKYPIGRANYTNDEKNYNVGLSLNYTFNFSELFKNDVKAGYFGTYKKATNQQESVNFRVVQGAGTDQADIYFPISQLLDGSYYHYGGFGWERETYYGNRYEGDVKVHSPFLMLDNKIGRLARLVWGVRAESYVYTEISSQSARAGDLEVEQKDEEVWKYLPSASLTISPTNKINIRLGYNKSVLRPQFAERLKIPFYDPIRSALVLNTAGLVSTVSDNYDLKFEWFPASGQVLSLGVYHKNIKDPIEGVTQIGGDGGSRTIYNMNSHSAKLWGVEMELLKNLSFLGEGRALEELFIYANGALNATRVTGYVNIDGTGGVYKADRPLFGQSPYTYNLGLDYVGERLGFSLRHNGIGDQYILVGFDYNSEEIRMPYTTTDLSVSWRFFKAKNLQLKCSARNLFDRPIETYNNFNSYSVENKNHVPYASNPRDFWSLATGSTKRYDEDIDRKLFKAYSGTTFSMTIGYSF